MHAFNPFIHSFANYSCTFSFHFQLNRSCQIIILTSRHFLFSLCLTLSLSRAHFPWKSRAFYNVSCNTRYLYSVWHGMVWQAITFHIFNSFRMEYLISLSVKCKMTIVKAYGWRDITRCQLFYHKKRKPTAYRILRRFVELLCCENKTICCKFERNICK